MIPLRNPSRLADAADVEMAFRLALGRRPGRAADVDFHIGKPLYGVLLHILASGEARQKVLPRLAPVAGAKHELLAAISAAGDMLVDPPMRAWLGAMLGLEVAPRRRWPGVLVDWLHAPGVLAGIEGKAPSLAATLRRAMSSTEVGPEAPPVAPAVPDPPADWPAALAVLLFGPEAREAPPIKNMELREAARALVSSPAFAERILAPLMEAPAQHVAGPGVAARAVAMQLIDGGAALAGPDEPWPRLLLRLLLHPASCIAAEGLDGTGALAAWRDRALATQAATDPLLASPLFCAAVTPDLDRVLHALVLGRAPRPVPGPPPLDAAALLLRLLLMPEFEVEVLGALIAGRPLRHATLPPLLPAERAMLARLFGRAPEHVAAWRREIIVLLGTPALQAILLALDTTGRARLEHLLAVLALLDPDAPLPFTLDWRDELRLAVSAAGGVEVRLVLHAPVATELCQAMVPDPAMSKAVLALPLAGFEPTTFAGSLTVLNPAGSPLGPALPIRRTVAKADAARLRERVERYVVRARAHALAGQRAEAIRLTRRATEEAPQFLEAWLFLAELLAAGGDLPGAAAALAPVQPLALKITGLTARAARLSARVAGEPPEFSPDRLAAEPRMAVLALAEGFASPPVVARALAAAGRLGLLDPFALPSDPDLAASAWLFLDALSLLPPGPSAGYPLLCALSRLAVADGRPADGLAFADAALDRRPNDTDALMLRAQAHRRQNDYSGAVATLEHLLAIQPDHEAAAERLLTFELDLARTDPLRPQARLDALLAGRAAALHRKLATDRTSAALRLDLARLSIAAGQTEDATALLAQLAAEQPGWAAPVQMLIGLALDSGDGAAVLAAYGKLPLSGRNERAINAAAKALRALGKIEAAQALLAAHLDSGFPGVRREHARNHFFAGRFEAAAAEAARWIPQQPEDHELRMLAAAAALELGQDAAAAAQANELCRAGAAQHHPVELPLFLCAATARGGDWNAALSHLDLMFARHGARPVRRDPSLGTMPFDQLYGHGAPPRDAGSQPPHFDGPMVSVVMTTWNVKALAPTAIRSILDQSYRNLELLIVDDASTDGTPAVLEAFESADPRVRVILKTTNDGTYVSKNMGLLQARGTFIALQDSDDWSHPDRLACSLGVLQRRPDLVGLTTDWLRMTSEGRIVVKAGGQISHSCCISLVFRRAPVLERLGFFDSVRIAADLEFIQRMGLVFGSRAVPRLRWPLLFGRARSDSLTANEEFGLSRTGFTPIRAAYHEAAAYFHARIRAGDLGARMPFPLAERRFSAPIDILPEFTP
ncbi:glycosyltransferase [Falsiroseomonas sp. E2-1-a20]|uniref:glycosyltransferase n=1 Tax=Falsiroseomonas sp. E2-1-a20 TaxID=3239300 RepID=UPI003F2D6E87